MRGRCRQDSRELSLVEALPGTHLIKNPSNKAGELKEERLLGKSRTRVEHHRTAVEFERQSPRDMHRQLNAYYPLLSAFCKLLSDIAVPMQLGVNPLGTDC